MQSLIIVHVFMLHLRLLIADEAIINPKSDYTKRLLGDVPKIYEPWDFSQDLSNAS